MATASPATIQTQSFPAKGSLKRLSFPRLLREIARAKLTGSLYLLSGETKKVVFFDEGQPIFVRSNVLSECLGQVLAHEGLITQEQCEQTLEAIRRTGKKQGELLVEMGILSHGNLRYGLEAQLRTKLYDIFTWEDGRYQFKAGPPHQQSGIRFNMSVESMIIAAIQDRFDEARASAALEVYKHRYAVTRIDAIDAHHLDLLPEERHFLLCLDGSCTVEQLLDENVVPSVPTLVPLLYGLLQAGAVQVAEHKLPAKPHPAAPDLTPSRISDDKLSPTFAASHAVTEYEDTPLPGELPRDRDLLGEEEGFAGVDDEEEVSAALPLESTEMLLAAEPKPVEDTFEDVVELLGDDEMVEIVDPGSGPLIDDNDDFDDHLAHQLTQIDDDLVLSPESRELLLTQPAVSSDTDELVGLDELDDVDLGESVGTGMEKPASGPKRRAPTNSGESPDVIAAMRFNEGESAMQRNEWHAAVEALEEAYENGFDVAELHAMLAYARFMANGGNRSTAGQALDLLRYAERLDPNLDILHAYRGAVLRATGDAAAARKSLERALEINPYCEIAMEIMDAFG